MPLHITHNANSSQKNPKATHSIITVFSEFDQTTCIQIWRHPNSTARPFIINSLQNSCRQCRCRCLEHELGSPMWFSSGQLDEKRLKKLPVFLSTYAIKLHAERARCRIMCATRRDGYSVCVLHSTSTMQSTKTGHSQYRHDKRILRPHSLPSFTAMLL